MSMGRLLATGRSLIGAQNASSRYRMDKRARLPKFGSTKNPFAAAHSTPEVNQPVPPQPTNSADAEPVVRATPPAANPIPASAPATRLRRAVRRLQEWYLEVNPLPRLAGPARSAFTAVPRPSGPIQSELSLDTVRVVRNDLSDADLEIVPVKPARRADAVPLPEENAWSRLTTRIFVQAKRD